MDLTITGNMQAYRASLEKNADNRLVDLYQLSPVLHFAIAYATADNVTGRQLYRLPAAYLRQPAAQALAEAHQTFRKLGYGICIFDAYRPHSVTQVLWDCIQDARYVAEPWVGSRHNRGCSVDLTLYDLDSGGFLEMPTEYDDFSEKAHHGNTQVSERAIQHRELLSEVMCRHQFQSFATEWWHYDFVGWAEYGLLDIGFEALVAHHE